LAALDPRLQTVNMGQGGYGIDQVFLWYRRDGTRFEHDLHLFAFITTDFERMESTEFLGYGKPRLAVRDNQLVVENVPVPRRPFYVPWLTQNSQALNQLRLVQLFSRSRPVAPPTPSAQPAFPTQAVAGAILQELIKLNRAKGSTLVLVYLPTLADYEPVVEGATERWRAFLPVAAQDTGVIFIDLVEELRALPPEAVQPLFIPAGALDFAGAAGHYSVAGNEVVARWLYEQLVMIPAVAERLDQIE
jgi:hypothetical protein